MKDVRRNNYNKFIFLSPYPVRLFTVLQEYEMAIEAKDLSSFLPVLIAVRGKIGADSPLQSKISNTRAVLIEETSEWSALRQNEKGVWLPDSEIVKKCRLETPWYIKDESSGRLGVESCANANHLEKTLTTYKDFKDGEASYYKKVYDRLSGFQPLGVWHIEKCLPVDTNVTVVGELALSAEDKNGMIVRKPSKCFNGKPFYITDQKFEELKESIVKNTETYKWLGVGFGTVGLILVGVQLWKHIRSTMKYRRIRRHIAEEKRKRASRDTTEEGIPDETPLDLESEDRGKCIVCCDNPIDAVFIPCGHLCACMTCCKELKRCPVCRDPCKVYKIYFV